MINFSLPHDPAAGPAIPGDAIDLPNVLPFPVVRTAGAR